MSKLSREVLKEIVKECIVEIFEESFFNQGSVLSESRSRRGSSVQNKRSISPRRPKTRSSNIQNLGTRSSLDTVSYGQKTVRNESYDRKISNITNKLTNDPVMAEIFKDTANSTLQTQTSAESSRGPSVLSGGDAAAMKVHNSDPTELFAESASKWATLAFADPVKK